MYISAATQQTAQQWQAANPDLYAFLFGATVQFYGTAASGDAFTATGVVVRATPQYAEVVTAKHNLFIAGPREADPAAYYCQRIRARLYPPAGQVHATIDSVRVLDAGVLVNQGLDIMVVRVTDGRFVAAARALVADGGPGERFRPAAPALNAGWIIRPANEAGGEAVVMNGRPYGGLIPGADDFTLVHMGYGKIRGDQSGYAFRVMPAATLATPTLVPATHDGWHGVMTYAAGPADTATSGDSGGPIFAISPPIVPPAQAVPAPGAPAPAQGAPAQGAQAPGAQAPAQAAPPRYSVALVGVHSGANYFADPAEDWNGRPTVNNAMTLTPRERLA